VVGEVVEEVGTEVGVGAGGAWQPVSDIAIIRDKQIALYIFLLLTELDTLGGEHLRDRHKPQ
jgi:hypothetical protein